MKVNKFAVRRVDGCYDVAAARQHFRTHGLVILKNLLPPDTQKVLRDVVESELAAAVARGNVRKFAEFPEADFIEGDVLSLRGLDTHQHIFFNREALDVIRTLLGTPNLVYWGDSSVQFGEAARGFHKDNVDRSDGTLPDWLGPYDLVRCGFYFQDHSQHSGGLKVRLGSHDIPNHLDGRMCDVLSEYGDLVIWNMRLTHSGNNRRLRFASSLCLHPRLEARCPVWMCRPEQLRRVGAFCAFGKAGPQLDRYIDRMNERASLYHRPFQFSRKPPEAQTLVSNYGLSFRTPHANFGELD